MEQPSIQLGLQTLRPPVAYHAHWNNPEGLPERLPALVCHLALPKKTRFCALPHQHLARKQRCRCRIREEAVVIVRCDQSSREHIPRAFVHQNQPLDANRSVNFARVTHHLRETRRAAGTMDQPVCDPSGYSFSDALPALASPLDNHRVRLSVRQA